MMEITRVIAAYQAKNFVAGIRRFMLQVFRQCFVFLPLSCNLYTKNALAGRDVGTISGLVLDPVAVAIAEIIVHTPEMQTQMNIRIKMVDKKSKK